MSPGDWVKRDAGKGVRGGDRGDCQVRALSIATGMGWNECWAILYTIQGEKRECGFQLHKWLGVHDLLPKPLESYRRTPGPGSRMLTVADFAFRFPTGSWVVKVANHLTVVEDGVVFDTWDCRAKCVYKAWRLR